MNSKGTGRFASFLLPCNYLIGFNQLTEASKGMSFCCKWNWAKKSWRLLSLNLVEAEWRSCVFFLSKAIVYDLSDSDVMLSRREEKQKLKSIQLKVWQNPFGLHVGFNLACVSVQVYVCLCMCHFKQAYTLIFRLSCFWVSVYNLAWSCSRGARYVSICVCVFVSRQCTTAQKKWHFIPWPPRQKRKKRSLLPWKWQVTPRWKVCWCCETASRGERVVKRKEQGSLKMGLIDWTHTHRDTPNHTNACNLFHSHSLTVFKAAAQSAKMT